MAIVSLALAEFTSTCPSPHQLLLGPRNTIAHLIANSLDRRDAETENLLSPRFVSSIYRPTKANMAQLVEQLIRNQ